ncbi:MAG: sugar phosphate isomerase/epimerase family protein [Phycisphaerales bacterium]
MPRLAFSTVATPDWTLTAVVRSAARWGYDGVELRTFGSGSRAFACDPALTAADKVRRIFADHGLTPACLATSISLDESVRPPVVGRLIGDFERPVRLVKEAIDLAAAIECPLVRVFGFQLLAGERRAACIARIAERLALVADAARNIGVRVVVENGGSFATAAQLNELLDAATDPLLGAAYCSAVAFDAGENPAASLDILGDRLWVAKVKDRDSHRRMCVPGDGVTGCEAFVRELGHRKYGGWIIHEWDRAWLPDLAEPSSILPDAAARIGGWLAQSRPQRPHPARA